MELADTSAWIARQRDASVLGEFSARLEEGEVATCDMVKLELLWSARDQAQFVALREDLDALENVPIAGDAWRRAIEVFELLAARAPLHHRQVKIPDLLIAAAAELAGVPVVHYDRDFEVIARVTGQRARAIAPLGSLS